MTHKKKTLDGKVESTKVFHLRPNEDEKGRYYSVCEFGYHQGIVLSEEIYTERKCIHYRRLYL